MHIAIVEKYSHSWTRHAESERWTDLHGTEGRASDDGGGVSIEAVLCENLARLQLDQLYHLTVVYHVHLVDVHHDALHSYLWEYVCERESK